MKKTIISAAARLFIGSYGAQAQVGLDTYADAKGMIDVQKFTCAQLANTFREDANAMALWYSGWYNGLGKKHFFNYPRAKESEHLVIEYCKANQNKTVIEAIGAIIREQEKSK